jgi:hypothetical protein
LRRGACETVRIGIFGYGAGKSLPFVLLLQRPECWWKRHIGHRMCVRFFSETVFREFVMQELHLGSVQQCV